MPQQHETRDPWIEPITIIANGSRVRIDGLISTWEIMHEFFGPNKSRELSTMEAARRIENIMVGLGFIPIEPNNEREYAPYLWTRP